MKETQLRQRNAATLALLGVSVLGSLAGLTGCAAKPTTSSNCTVGPGVSWKPASAYPAEPTDLDVYTSKLLETSGETDPTMGQVEKLQKKIVDGAYGAAICTPGFTQGAIDNFPVVNLAGQERRLSSTCVIVGLLPQDMREPIKDEVVALCPSKRLPWIIF